MEHLFRNAFANLARTSWSAKVYGWLSVSLIIDMVNCMLQAEDINVGAINSALE